MIGDELSFRLLLRREKDIFVQARVLGRESMARWLRILPFRPV